MGSWNNTNKVHRVIEFNQEAWLNPQIDMNMLLRKQTKKNVEKDLKNVAFGKIMENVKKCRDIKFVTKQKLASIGAKLLHKKMVFRKATGN